MKIWEQHCQIIIIPPNAELLPHWSFKWRDFNNNLPNECDYRFYVRVNGGSYYVYDLSEIHPDWVMKFDINPIFNRIHISPEGYVSCYYNKYEYVAYHGEFNENTIERILFECLDPTIGLS